MTIFLTRNTIKNSRHLSKRNQCKKKRKVYTSKSSIVPQYFNQSVLYNGYRPVIGIIYTKQMSATRHNVATANMWLASETEFKHKTFIYGNVWEYLLADKCRGLSTSNY